MATVLDNFLEELDWQEVEKDSHSSSETEILGVDCLGTCLALAAYDSGTGTAYLLHASTIENDDLEEDVENFLEKLEDISRPYEVLAGGTMESKYNPLSDKDFTSEAREMVESKLEDKDISYEASWNDPPVYNRMVVSPEHGILYDRPE